MKASLLDLMKESVIIQGALTLLVVGVWLYMLMTQAPVPDSLNQIVGLCVGFYFGGKLQIGITRNAEISRTLQEKC